MLYWELQNLRLRGYLNLLEEQFGRAPEELREEARREWDAMKLSWKEEREWRARAERRWREPPR